MERDWMRLGDAIRRERKAAGMSQPALGEALGVSRATIQAIERGAEFKKPTPTHRAAAAHFRWTPDSLDAVLAGGEPAYADADQRAATFIANTEGATPADLPLRIKTALADGPLLDATVLTLPGDDDDDPDAQMVVIVKGREGATPEQVRRALLRWEKTEAQLRRSGTEQATFEGGAEK
ncbi:helix-turn-helix domain-containing protein [Streptomyces rimosus]|uniref:helix-turn-helix domain-containing protein n=1 Tax=Streptomyces rimosus TaxID=1927 RepID=UPI0004C6E249|nr:helix-turn-helix transcriptional regulator [Streptomyces rimosus]